jgi:hypothetical protein
VVFWIGLVLFAIAGVSGVVLAVTDGHGGFWTYVDDLGGACVRGWLAAWSIALLLGCASLLAGIARHRFSSRPDQGAAR